MVQKVDQDFKPFVRCKSLIEFAIRPDRLVVVGEFADRFLHLGMIACAAFSPSKFATLIEMARAAGGRLNEIFRLPTFDPTLTFDTRGNLFYGYEGGSNHFKDKTMLRRT